MNRIDQKFTELRQKRKKAFIAFITAGDPSLGITEELVCSFEKAGVDIVELGVPFSDPLADGITIQASSQRALGKKVTLANILKSVRRIRKKSTIPIILMTYYNPVFSYGEAEFAREAQLCGVDGVIIPDLPPEEAKVFIRACTARKLATIFFIAPTTPPKRMRKIINVSTGFIYYLSLTGVTGMRQTLERNNASNILKVKRMTKKPVCVGFGISTPTQVRTASTNADGVIVGSAIVDQINKKKGKKNLVRDISRYVWTLTRGLKA